MPAPAIGVRPRWSPPVTAAVVDGDPLATRLVSAMLCLPGGGAQDLVARTLIPRVGTPGHDRTVFGPACRSTASGGAGLVTGTAGRFSLQMPLSYMWVGYVYGAAEDAFSVIFGCVYDNADGGPYSCYGFGWAGGGTIRIEHNEGGGDYRQADIGVAPVGPCVIVGTLSAANEYLWINGTRYAGTTGGGTILYSATSTMGFHYYGASRNPDVSSNFGAVWNRELGDGEVARLTADPFCFLRR